MKRTSLAIIISCLLSGSSFGQNVWDDGYIKLSESIDLGTETLWIGGTNSSNEVEVEDVTLAAGEVGVGVSASSSNNTLSFDGGVGTFSSYLTVGNEGSENELIIDDDSAVTSDQGIIGYSADADGNTAEVTDESSWGVTGVLTIGGGGALNSLYIGDESEVTSYHGIIGYEEDADGNSVKVTGDSSWEVTDVLSVGEEGASNILYITDGAEVTANTLNIGVQETAVSNIVLVSGSSLDVDDAIAVGKYGAGNQLIITNGGTVSSAEAWVGGTDDDYDDRDDDDNTVYVTGADSSWTVDGDLGIGTEDNTGNLVSVTNGGSIYIESLEILGEGNGFDLDNGGTLTVSSDFNASTTGFSFNDGGALYVNGELTGMTNGIEEGRTLGITDGGNWDQSGTNVTVGGSSSDNGLVVEGGTVMLANLQIGSVSNSGNTVVVSSSGKIVADDVAISGADSTLTLNSGGWLLVDTDFNAGMDGFEFGNGGVLETTGALTGMTNTLENSRILHLTGGTWDVGSELTVGDTTSGNAVYVKDGGTLTSVGAVIGAATNSLNNRFYVQDTGSVWNVGGALAVGEAGSDNGLYIENGGTVYSASSMIGGTGTDNGVWVQGIGTLWGVTGDLEISGSGNQLSISDGATVMSSGAFRLQDNATVSFSNGTSTAGSYYQDASSTLEFSTMTNIAVDAGTALIAATGAAEFEAGASVFYTGEISALSEGVTNSRKIAESSLLVVGGITNATGVDLDVLNSNPSQGLLTFSFYEEDDDLFMQVFRQNLAAAAGFESNTQMYAVSSEIDDMADQGNMIAGDQLSILNGMSQAQMNSQLTQLYAQSAPTYAHMDGLFEGLRQVKTRGVMPDSMWPIGAYGPHLYGSQAQGWIKGYGSWADRDGEGVNSSYDQSIYGVVLGVDKAHGNFMTGIAGGYVSSDISQNNGDSSKAGTGYGVLYTSWGTWDWFADASIAYGMGSVKNDSGTVFDTSSEMDANQFAYNLSGGKEMIFMEDRFFLTPSAGILGGNYSQDAYTEKSSNAVAKQVDAYNRWSFQSELGVKASYHKQLTKNVLMPEAHANWLHQFNADADQLGYSLVGGSGNYNLGMQAPVADLFELGVGLSLWTESKQGVVSEWMLGFDGRFGDGYSATALSARMMFEF